MTSPLSLAPNTSVWSYSWNGLLGKETVTFKVLWKFHLTVNILFLEVSCLKKMKKIHIKAVLKTWNTKWFFEKFYFRKRITILVRALFGLRRFHKTAGWLEPSKLAGWLFFTCETQPISLSFLQLCLYFQRSLFLSLQLVCRALHAGELIYQWHFER